MSKQQKHKLLNPVFKLPGIIFLFLLCTFSSFAQVTLKAERIPLKEVLSQIENVSKYKFFYNEDLEILKRSISIDVKNESIDGVMKILLRDSNVGYKKQGENLITLVPHAILSAGEIRKDIRISGSVKDETGAPIIGANVVVKGSTIGTITDLDGKFDLEVPADANLLVTYIGYLDQAIAIKGRRSLNIVMQEDTKTLEEVVVVGYGSQRKRDLTGAVVSLDEGKFIKGVTTNAFQMINGKAAGVNISQTSSAPGAGTKIQIRGAGSINSSNSALVVVDGLPGVDPSSISPDDIKSIEVLKDASSAAIYGTRASNGVVLITTKSGEKDKTLVKFNAEYGIQNVAKKMEVLNAQQYMETLNAIRIEGNQSPIYSDADMQKVGEGTNWQNEIFTTNAPMQNYQLSFTGDANKSNYYVGLSYMTQDGLVKNSSFNKLNARANFNFDSRDYLRFKGSVNFTRSRNNALYENMDGVNEAAGAINSSLQFDPTLPVGIDPITNRYYMNDYISLDNPMALINGVTNHKQINTVYGTFTTEFEPVKDLIASARLGGSVTSLMNSFYRDRTTIFGLGSKGVGSKEALESTQWLAEFLLSYKKSVGNHNLNLLLGTTLEEFMNQGVKASGKGFLSDVTSYNLLESGDKLNGDDIESSKDRTRLNGILGRLNYQLLDRYMLTLSFRYDGSSKFSKDKQYAFFPSMAAAWRISSEPFFKLNIVDDMKLRIGYGQLGNQGIKNYQTINTLVSGGSAVFGNTIVSGVKAARLPNTALTWETTSETNFGLDFALFKSRLSGSLDYFIRDTRNQLFDKPLPASIGFSSIKVNAGTVRNMGLDATINAAIIQKKHFNWDASLTMSLLQNKVIDLPDYIPQLITGYAASFVQNYHITKVGSPMYAFYGYEVEGVFQKGDDVASSGQPNATPGGLKFKDQNGDKIIDANDRVILGKPFPSFTGGLSNKFRYKNFTLDVFLHWVKDIQTLDINVLETLYPTNEYRNRIAQYYLNRWTETNPSQKYPSGVNSSNYGGQYSINSLTVSDASFLRLKTINLTYDVPLKSNKQINTLQLYASVDNIFTWTKYDGYDPDASAKGDNVSKVNYNSYPLARTFRFGFNVTF